MITRKANPTRRSRYRRSRRHRRSVSAPSQAHELAIRLHLRLMKIALQPLDRVLKNANLCSTVRDGEHLGHTQRSYERLHGRANVLNEYVAGAHVHRRKVNHVKTPRERERSVPARTQLRHIRSQTTSESYEPEQLVEVDIGEHRQIRPPCLKLLQRSIKHNAPHGGRTKLH